MISWRSLIKGFNTLTLKQTIQNKFDNIEKFVELVARGVNPSCLITGSSGVGKSYIVTKTLQNGGLRQGVDYIIIKGNTSPLGLYTVLLNNKNKLIVFDDCDSVFNDAKSLNLLKAGLDSYSKRIISWLSRPSKNHVPSFEFTGKIIFISNLAQSKIDNAVKSRTFVVDIQLSKKEVLAYLESILFYIEPSIPIQCKKDVLTYLKGGECTLQDINLRSFIKGVRIKTGLGTGSNWKELINLMS